MIYFEQPEHSFNARTGVQTVVVTGMKNGPGKLFEDISSEAKCYVQDGALKIVSRFKPVKAAPPKPEKKKK